MINLCEIGVNPEALVAALKDYGYWYVILCIYLLIHFSVSLTGEWRKGQNTWQKVVCALSSADSTDNNQKWKIIIFNNELIRSQIMSNKNKLFATSYIVVWIIKKQIYSNILLMCMMN